MGFKTVALEMSSRGSRKKSSPQRANKNQSVTSVAIRRFRVVISVLGIIVSIFDLVTDWYTFKEFYTYDSGKKTLTILLGVASSVATILCFLEIYQGLSSFYVYFQRKKETQYNVSDEEVDDADPRERQRKEELKVECLQETTTFLLLIFEDIPSAVILYVAFKEANCQLHRRVFDETLVALLSLSGTAISAAWKGLQSIIYMVQCCRFYDMKRCENRVMCCFCRILRPFIAAVLIIFVSFLFLYAIAKSTYEISIGDYAFGLQPRYDCAINGTVNGTMFSTMDPVTMKS